MLSAQQRDTWLLRLRQCTTDKYQLDLGKLACACRNRIVSNNGINKEKSLPPIVMKLAVNPRWRPSLLMARQCTSHYSTLYHYYLLSSALRHSTSFFKPGLTHVRNGTTILFLRPLQRCPPVLPEPDGEQPDRSSLRQAARIMRVMRLG